MLPTDRNMTGLKPLPGWSDDRDPVWARESWLVEESEKELGGIAEGATPPLGSDEKAAGSVAAAAAVRAAMPTASAAAPDLRD